MPAKGQPCKTGFLATVALGPLCPLLLPQRATFPRKTLLFLHVGQSWEGSLLGGLQSRQGLWLLNSCRNHRGFPDFWVSLSTPSCIPRPHTHVLCQAWISAQITRLLSPYLLLPQVVMGLHLSPYFHTLHGHATHLSFPLSSWLPGCQRLR